MEICLVRRRYSITGGAENYGHRLATHLADHGCTVNFLCEEWNNESPTSAKVTALGPSASPLAFADSIRDHLARNPALNRSVVFSLERIHEADIYRAGDGVHALWLEIKNRNHLLKRWFDPLNPKHRNILKLESQLFRDRKAKFVIANSKRGATEIVNRFSYPLDRLHTIYNGIDLDRFSTPRSGEIRKQLGITPDDFMILLVGSGWERKGIPQAIRAVEMLKGYPIKLVILSKDRAPLVTHNGRVIFAGTSRTPELYYAESDLFTLPSLYEPFSNACLEALASGLPVVTSAINGFSEVLTESTGSVVQDPTDAASLAGALKGYLDKNRLKLLKGKCREEASQFTMKRNLEETMKVITLAYQEKNGSA
ncbi:MAG: glycosyltransferase family 4 protein [Verrucomicrobiota bacterium]|nr:glycosyltransferase family 4 protein [Verrucomicrobiota bacterium]